MYRLESPFKPTGDQPAAIKQLVRNVEHGPGLEQIGPKNARTSMNPAPSTPMRQTLLGATGTGKTFTMSNVIAQTNRPALVISHNKTLAAQLYNEFKEFFPHNNVGYFVSYFDYYQPESYLPAQDLYIEKDTKRNEKIEQMRLEATAQLLSSRNTIIIATVSCIYGLGSPQDFEGLSVKIQSGQEMNRQELLRQLISIQYTRTDEPKKGGFRVKGDTVDIFPGFGEDAYRLRFYGNQLEKITLVHGISGNKIRDLKSAILFPAKHFVTSPDKTARATETIRAELDTRLPELQPLEAHRLNQRTEYDLDQIKELGYCSGIENYSRHFDGRVPGSPPSCLMDFFPKDFLMIIDESHVTLPQLHAMYKGDFARKKNLIDYGFRLPSAFDNRPLKFEEFENYMTNAVFVSATPSPWELAQGPVVEQLIRPTGIVDPEIEVRPAKDQIADVQKQIAATTKNGHRTLVTVLTKRFAEDLTEYLDEKGVKVRYLHSEVENLERTEILRQLRLGEFDCLIGINLLREGLDLPEVALVAILDADKEGFLRGEKSLIQTTGRACRNTESRVIMYADKMTDSMTKAIHETHRRRMRQMAYNKAHHITPKTIQKKIAEGPIELQDLTNMPEHKRREAIVNMEIEMHKAAEQLDFEKAIALRNQLRQLQKNQKVKPTK
ncbi:excinuclease ABC subunit UvrB [Candidatus Micrarchaeota archaeon]|nr:excinuclease ABC subunit UvrB [Candidatus Micrarchaeota archaeon]